MISGLMRRSIRLMRRAIRLMRRAIRRYSRAAADEQLAVLAEASSRDVLPHRDGLSLVDLCGSAVCPQCRHARCAVTLLTHHPGMSAPQCPPAEP